jgi:hypothetical protein
MDSLVFSSSPPPPSPPSFAVLGFELKGLHLEPLY